MKYALRMTEAQHNVLRSHLFPGDGNEAVALLLCGRRKGQERHILSVRKVVKVPHTVCDPRPDRITWPTGFVDSLLEEAYGNECAIVKVHSHGIDYRKFSETDNRSDQGLFASVTSLLNDGLPHASVIMLQDGEVFGRVLGEDGKVLSPLTSIMAVGDELRIWTCPFGKHVRRAQLIGQLPFCGPTTGEDEVGGDSEMPRPIDTWRVPS